MTYVHRERLTGQPLVIAVVAPTAQFNVADISEHHITVKLGDQRVVDHPDMPMLAGEDVGVQWVFTRENAGKFIETVVRGLTTGEVDANG